MNHAQHDGIHILMKNMFVMMMGFFENWDPFGILSFGTFEES